MEANGKELLFLQLVMQHQQLALVSLGKTQNPVTNKIEVNLEYVKLSIDTLEMLKEKTNGNLSDYELKFLDETLRELKLGYVDEMNKQNKA